MMSATFCKNPSKKWSFAFVRPHAGCKNSLPPAMHDDSLPCTVQTSKLPSITIYLMVIGTASILWGVEFVHCRVSVRLSVGLSAPTWAYSSKPVAVVGQADRRYRSIAAWRTAVRRAASECGQWHVVSVRRRPNTDLLVFYSSNFISYSTVEIIG